MRLTLILIFSSILLFSCANQKRENSCIVIPEHYSGPVLIIFNQENGEAKKYKAKKRVYEINENGVLKTQFNPMFSYHSQKIYFSKNNDRTEIPILIRLNNAVRDTLSNYKKLYAYGFKQSGKTEKYDPDTRELISISEPTLSFYIGTIEEYDSSFMKTIKFLFDHTSD